MGCQYSIANQILEKGGNYVFSLKGNQENLSNDVRLYFDDEELRKNAQFCEDFDKGHGRIEHRKCWVTNEIDWSTFQNQKCGLHREYQRS